MKNNKHVKYIRIRNNNPKSVVELKNKYFFQYLYNPIFIEYRLPLLDWLFYTIKFINYKDKLDFADFEAILIDTYVYTEALNDTSLPNYIIKEIINDLYNLYCKNKYLDFRGEILELVVLLLLRNDPSKLYHEPVLYNKRKRLIDSKSKGDNSLVDFVNVYHNKKKFSLIECKANLDNQIKSLNNPKNSFQYKLRYMDRVESVLSDYKNFNDEYVEINKLLVTLLRSYRNLPDKYNGYTVINVLDRYLNFRMSS